jgi:hypothetical protein
MGVRLGNLSNNFIIYCNLSRITPHVVFGHGALITGIKFYAMVPHRLFWVSSLAYPNLLGTKGYVVVVDGATTCMSFDTAPMTTTCPCWKTDSTHIKP